LACPSEKKGKRRLTTTLKSYSEAHAMVEAQRMPLLTRTHAARMGTQMKKTFMVSKSVYEFALKYQGLQGEISGAFPHQTFTIQATSGELEDLFSLLRFLALSEPFQAATGQ
jgi:hypothetical protein